MWITSWSVRLAPSASEQTALALGAHRPLDEAKEKLQECYDREWFKTAPMYIVGMKNVNENWACRYDEKPHGDIDVAQLPSTSVSGCHRKRSGHLLGLQL